MKKLLFFSGFLIFFNISPAECADGTASAEDKVYVKDVITTLAPYPKDAIDKGVSSVVTVTLYIDNRGLVKVLKVESAEPVLANYVRESLDGKVLGPKTQTGRVQLKLDYQLL